MEDMLIGHLVLLGDSIFDNGRYVDGPDVVEQVRAIMPTGCRASLCAIDGAVSSDIEIQLRMLPVDATHIVLSVGGNDALGSISILQASVSSAAEAFLSLGEAVDRFERSYRRALRSVAARGLPVTVCTIYNANFPDRLLQRCVRLAVAVYNDAIIRVAREMHFPYIDLREVCTEPADYANDIEPSVVGGAKIAQAIINASTTC